MRRGAAIGSANGFEFVEAADGDAVMCGVVRVRDVDATTAGAADGSAGAAIGSGAATGGGGATGVVAGASVAAAESAGTPGSAAEGGGGYAPASATAAAWADAAGGSVAATVSAGGATTRDAVAGTVGRTEAEGLERARVPLGSRVAGFAMHYLQGQVASSPCSGISARRRPQTSDVQREERAGGVVERGREEGRGGTGRLGVDAGSRAWYGVAWSRLQVFATPRPARSWRRRP